MRSSGCQQDRGKIENVPNSSHIAPSVPLGDSSPVPSHTSALDVPSSERQGANPPSFSPAFVILSTTANACPGALIEYGITMFLHYPWHLHAPECDFLTYSFAYIDPQGRFFYARNNKCTRKPSKKGGPCVACIQVPSSRQFQDLLARASPDKDLHPSTNIKYRTYAQLCDLLKDRTKQKKVLQLKQVNLNRRIESLIGRMDNQKRLVAAIAQSDNAAIGCIVQTALKQGAGVQTIINRLANAQEGLYSPRTFSPKLFDLAILINKIGGPRLLFAVAEEMHLPSLSTVNSRLKLPQLLPSVGFPSIDEVLANIESFFGPNATGSDSGPRNMQAGFSLMIDEIAIEPRLRYSVKQDMVVGLAQEDSHLLALDKMSTRSNPVDVLFSAKALLDAGTCHRASEASMVAIARFGSSDYNPVIIAASGTCKTEKALDQEHWI